MGIVTSKTIAIVMAICGVIVYQLGLLDRPKFHYEAPLLQPYHHSDAAYSDAADTDAYYVIVATSSERDIGRHRERLIEGIARGIARAVSAPGDGSSELEDNDDDYDELPPLMRDAGVIWYGTDMFQSIAVGFYFDDPGPVKNPRWAVGWSVVNTEYDDIVAMMPNVKNLSGLEEPIRLVRIDVPETKTLRVSIPWRNRFTPYIGPVMQWDRACRAFRDGGYEQDDGSKASDFEDGTRTEGPVAMEIYVAEVTGSKSGGDYREKYHHIDYVLMFGNTQSIWDDALGLKSSMATPTADENLSDATE